MNIRDAESLALIAMTEHGLLAKGWRFKFDKAKSRFGQCNSRLKTISLSAPLVRLNDEDEVVDTILHEIAHALVGARAGHGYVWKRKAIEIGCSAQRTTGSNVISPPKKYVGECPKGHKHFRDRLPRTQRSCGRCCSTFNEKYLIGNWLWNPEHP